MSDTPQGGAPAPAQAAQPALSGKERLIAHLLKPATGGEKPAVAGEPVPDALPVAEADPAASTAPETAETTVSDAPEEAAVADSAADPEPEPPPAKPKPENARLAKALVDLEAAQGRAMRLESRLKALETQLNEASADPLKALALAKHDPEQLIQKMLEGQIKKPDEPKLTPEQKALQELQERLAKVEQERNDALAKETYRQELAAITDKVKDRPIAGVFPWAAERIYTAFYQQAEKMGDTPDLDDVIEQVENHIAGDLRLALSSERALKTLIESDAKAREIVVKALGLQAPTTETKKPARQESKRAPEVSDGPKNLTNAMAAEVPARSATERKSAQERREASIARLLSKHNKQVSQ